MNDRDALMAAIAAHPGEDAPRLALADWLEEHGTTEADRARGAFIRLWFERARLPERSPEHTAADARYQELHQKYGAAWYAPLPRYTRGYWVERGMLEGVRLVGQQITQWDRHMRWCPTITHLILRHCRGRLAPVLATPSTAKLRELDIGGVDTADLEAVAACPHLANLKVLKLHWATADDIIAILRSRVLPVTRVVLGWYGNQFRGSIAPTSGTTLWATSFSMRWQWEHVPRLLACPDWAKVRELWLPWRQSQNQRIAEPLGEILERAPHLTGVRELSLSGNALDDNQARALVRCPALGALESLVAGHNQIGDDGVEAIIARWPNLTTLDLTENAVGSRGARAIAKHATRLETLALESNNIFLPGIIALAQAPRLASLKALHLKNTPGDSLGAGILADSPHLKPGVANVGTGTPIKSNAVLEELESLPEAAAIKTLRLRDDGITDKGLKAVARNEHLTNLTELDMQFCAISKTGLNALAKWPGLRSLKTFSFMTSVNYQCCSGKDFEKLFRSPHWGELEHLKIDAGHRLRDEGVAALAKAKFLPTLRELKLLFHEVTDTGAAALAKVGAFPAVQKLELGWDSKIGTAGVVALAGCRWPSLEEFESGNLTDEGLTALAAAPFPALTKVTLRGEKLTAAGIRALAAAPWFAQLTALDLCGKSLSDDAVRTLVEAPARPAGLTVLRLSLPKLTAVGASLLANSALAGRVTDLYLSDLSGGADLGQALAAGHGFTAVTTFNLRQSRSATPGYWLSSARRTCRD